MPPRELAAEIINQIDVDDISETPEIAGPGFINFKIQNSTIHSRLDDILSSDRLGIEESTTPEKILIDFSSPNIAKPMHIGHIRSTIIGDCLRRVANFLGHDVIADNHIGDWGTPIGQVIYGWKNNLNESAFNEDPIKELLRLYQLVKEGFESDPKLMLPALKRLSNYNRETKKAFLYGINLRKSLCQKLTRFIAGWTLILMLH